MTGVMSADKLGHVNEFLNSVFAEVGSAGSCANKGASEASFSDYLDCESNGMLSERDVCGVMKPFVLQNRELHMVDVDGVATIKVDDLVLSVPSLESL